MMTLCDIFAILTIIGISVTSYFAGAENKKLTIISSIGTLICFTSIALLI